MKSLLEEVAQQKVATTQVEETTVKVQHPAIAAIVKPGEKMADLESFDFTSLFQGGPQLRFFTSQQCKQDSSQP